MSYTSVIQYKSLRMKLMVSTACNMEIWQINYTSTYLNAPNQVPVLMEQPKGYNIKPSKIYEVLLVASSKITDNK